MLIDNNDLQRNPEYIYNPSYIIDRIDSVKSAHPDCGVVLFGDFNTLDVTNILTNHTLKQLVREPTWGNSVLDLVISVDLNVHMNLFQGDSDQRFVTRIWLDYENQNEGE